LTLLWIHPGQAVSTEAAALFPGGWLAIGPGAGEASKSFPVYVSCAEPRV